MKKIVVLFILFFLVRPALAADFASTYKVDDAEAVNGDILIFSNGGMVRASAINDQRLFGVLADNAVVIVRSADTSLKAVARIGEAIVNVTSANGPIKRGDFITSSTTPGKGQKATISGYVLGHAMEDLQGDSGTVNVALKIEYAEISNAKTMSRLLDMFTVGLFRNVSDQGQFPMIMRYIIVGLIMLVSLAVSFITFARSVPKGIEAIGRNPLARGSILLSMGMSVGLVIGTLAIGLIISIVILKL